MWKRECVCERESLIGSEGKRKHAQRLIEQIKEVNVREKDEPQDRLLWLAVADDCRYGCWLLKEALQENNNFLTLEIIGK